MFGIVDVYECSGLQCFVFACSDVLFLVFGVGHCLPVPSPFLDFGFDSPMSVVWFSALVDMDRPVAILFFWI